MLTVPNTEIKYRKSSQGGLETQWENGEIWYFTWRGEKEVRELHPDIQGNLEENKV